MKKIIDAIYTYTNNFEPYYLDSNLNLYDRKEINNIMNYVGGKALVDNDNFISSAIYESENYYSLLKIKKNKLSE